MTHRSKFAALLLPWAACAALAQPALPITITDPAGDDHGEGTLSPPRDAAWAEGDLDLRTLTLADDGGTLRVEATFANPVRHPSGARGTGLGSEDLSVFARRGFYAFNLDLYLDLDRQPGLGLVQTLPGRGLRLDAATAWDKAVVLTPRPELMRRQLRDALEAGGLTGAALDAEIDRRVHFVTDVRVRGRTVSFTVPRAFVAPAQVANASLVAVVTAAKLSIESDVGVALVRGAPPPVLGALQPAPGRPADAVGYRGDRAPATAVVDLLAPDAAQQREQLARGVATGLAPENGHGRRAAAPSAAGASPADETLADPFARALAAVLGGTPAPVPVKAATTTLPAAPATPAAPPPPPAPAVPAAPPRPAAVAPVAPPPPAPAAPAARQSGREIEERLETLKRLRERNLITEAEYEQKRRELIERL